MSKREKEKRERQRQAQYEGERASMENFRRLAPTLKPVLRQVGCDLPFYDFLDSYEEEFSRTVSVAMREFPSLLGIHEVDENEFVDMNWTKYGADGLRQVFFSLDDKFAGYGANGNSKANIRGSAAFFLDGDGHPRSVVLIPRSVKCSFEHKELKYAFKIGSLLHELGHVNDAEKRINIDAETGRMDVVQAEAYANSYALGRLADRCLGQTYSILYEAMRELASSNGYEAEIGRLVLEQHRRRDIPNWNEYVDAAKAKAGGR